MDAMKGIRDLIDVVLGMPKGESGWKKEGKSNGEGGPPSASHER